MSILSHFIALDIETSGLNPKDAEILEVGAVQVSNGRITEYFHSFVKPSNEISDLSSRFTGITEAQVSDAPDVNSVLESLRAFVSASPIVAFHGRFEERFLGTFSPDRFGRIHSVRNLTRAAFPRLPDHRLETLTSRFGVNGEGAHKASRDASEVAAVYLGTVEVLKDFPLNVKEQMLQLLLGTQSDLLPILLALNDQPTSLTRSACDSTGPEDDRMPVNLVGESVQPSDGSGHPLDIEAIEQIFAGGGILAAGMDGFEVRDEQVQMSRAVAKAFNGAQFLAVEAGTGIGKSMAYLVPTVLHAVQNRSRVIISTNTRNLQDQLFFKDLPDLEALLSVRFRYAILKGRNNYICLNRWKAALQNPKATFTQPERIAALPLVIWAHETKTGDITENTAFNLQRSAGLWAKVCSDSGYCRSPRCRNNPNCFANQIRKAAQRTHVVVVNHSLLFSDLSTQKGILGDYAHLVLDEAHHVERVAAHNLGRELNIWRVKNLTDQLSSPGSTAAGTLPALQHWLSFASVDAPTLKAFEAGIRSAGESAEALWQKAQSFFEGLTKTVRQRQGTRSSPYAEKLRYRSDEATFDDVSDALQAFETALHELVDQLRNLSERLRNLPEDALPNRDELCGELEGRTEACDETLSDIGFLTTASDEATVYWIELPTRESSVDTRIFGVPLNVCERLVETLYEGMQTIVFTSATLGIRGKLDYFVQRMGLDLLPEDQVSLLCLGSPFDYETQALVCAPTFLPSPKSDRFQASVDALFRDLAVGVQKSTMVLFTSYGMLNRTYNAIKPDLQSEGILLLGQGIDGSPTHITERFRLNGHAVLLGTDSFWEGIDLPGETLQILGIARLPFAVPSEPLVAAQMEELEKQGKDPFFNYSVPEAILKFRQGFGRLIRSRTDRGAVIILDSRVLSTGYGRAFLDSLPVKHRTFDSGPKMIYTVRDWFEKATEAAKPLTG